MFIVLANDGWSTIYFNCYRAAGSVEATIFFLSLLLIGQYMLLNLFLTILLSNFADGTFKTMEEKEDFSLYREIRWYVRVIVNKIRKRPPPPKIVRRVVKDKEQ